MKKENKVKTSYYALATGLLEAHRDTWSKFVQLWERNELRAAYLLVDETIRHDKIQLDQHARTIDKEFYWLFIA